MAGAERWTVQAEINQVATADDLERHVQHGRGGKQRLDAQAAREPPHDSSGGHSGRCHHAMATWNYYKVLNNPTHPAHETVKEIDEIFRALAADIVANEGKGIFYAKNLLGWTDRAKTEEKQEISITYENRPTE